MKGLRVLKPLAVVVLLALITGAGALWAVARHGFSARAEPWAVEAWIARNVRRLATPGDAKKAINPVPLDAKTLAVARGHFADHCASCHGNDGRGGTTIGRGMYPKAPDMTQAATQELTDGEIFYIIQNGIRFTGMPAWGGEPHEGDGESWQLVHFIRHLPEVTPDELAEMRTLNPLTRAEWEEEQEKRKFLTGEEEPPAHDTPSHQH